VCGNGVTLENAFQFVRIIQRIFTYYSKWYYFNGSNILIVLLLTSVILLSVLSRMGPEITNTTQDTQPGDRESKRKRDSPIWREECQSLSLSVREFGRCSLCNSLSLLIVISLPYEQQIFLKWANSCTFCRNLEKVLATWNQTTQDTCIGFIVLLWLYSPLLGLGRCFRFLILYTVDITLWMGDQPVARPLPTHRTTQTQKKRRHTSMPWVGFEPMIPVFERAKTVHALDRATTVTGFDYI
jgi:hypothetical protein